MFTFEKEMSSKLLELGVQRIPQASTLPSSISETSNWTSLFRSIVLCMVKRGEFNEVVEILTQILTDLLKANSLEILCNKSSSSPVFECFLAVVESLNAALTQNLIELEILNSNSQMHCKPMPLRSMIQWGGCDKVPPLGTQTAKQIIAICMQVIPDEYIDFPISSSIGICPKYILGDAILTTCQYIFLSNPNLILADMKSLFNVNEEGQMRIEMLCLGCPNSFTYDEYLRMMRIHLPKMKLREQVKVMHLVCGSVTRSIMADPQMGFMSSESSLMLCKSLLQWVEKLRAFKPLRTLRTHEAVVISLLEIQKMVLEDTQQTTLMTTTTPSPSNNKLCNHISFNQHNEMCKENFISLNQTKTFEKVKSIIRKESSNEKKSHNFFSAALYLTIIGFVGWAASNRPGGEKLYGVALDILPFISDVSLVYDSFPKRSKILFLCFCANMDSDLFLKLLPKVESGHFFEVMRTLQGLTEPKHFQNVLCASHKHFSMCFAKMLSQNRRIDLCAGLEMLSNIEERFMAPQVCLDVVHQLCTLLQNPPDNFDDSELRVFEGYIEILYSKVINIEPNSVTSLSPLLPAGPATSNYYKLHKVQNLYLYLRLVASGKAVIPEKDLQSCILGKAPLQSLRTFLMLCLCVEESSQIADTALKCLELLQSEAYQSAPQRDLVSELLDSMEHVNPSILKTQQRMCKYLARSADSSFAELNKAVTLALESFPVFEDQADSQTDSSDSMETNNQPHTHIQTLTNLLMIKAATLSLEPKSARIDFYSSMYYLDGQVLKSLSKKEPVVSSEIALEFFFVYRQHFEQLFLIETERDSLLDSAICFYWLVDLLFLDNVFETKLALGELCQSFMVLLNSPAVTLSNEKWILKLVGKSARYVSGDPNGDIKVFDKPLQGLMNRKWLPGTGEELRYALAAVLENYKVMNDDDLLDLALQVSKFTHDENKTFPLITLLLRRNIKNVMHLCNRALSLNHICRACSYDALAYELSTRIDENSALFDKTEMVIFLLNHTPILEAFCDVCSVAGNDTLWSALLELFCSYSPNAERKLIQIAFNHEVNRTSNPAELLRSNSITMRIILEWMKVQSGEYLQKVLSPVLGSLRSATLRQNNDVDVIFSDSLIRYESQALPVKILWALQLLKEIVVAKFGREAARACIANLLSVRFICPAILSPHKYGLTSRAPAREFAKVLRKYAVYLQNKKIELKQSLMKQGGPKYISDCLSAEEIEFEINQDRTIQFNSLKTAPNIESLDHYTSATRHVFHLLRRHAVEIRMVLQTRGYQDLIFSMMRYLRLGKTLRKNDVDYEPGIELHGHFKSKKSLIITAQRICTDKIAAAHLLNCIKNEPLPLVIDFTDFVGITDLWSQSVSVATVYSISEMASKLHLTAINCPRSAYASLSKIAKLISCEVDIEFVDSTHFKTDVDAIPSCLSLARMAAADLKLAVPFEVVVSDMETRQHLPTTMFIGENFLQFKMEHGFEIIPYVNTHLQNPLQLAISMHMEDMFISCGGVEIYILKASPAMVRILKFNLDASQARAHGARIDMVTDNMLNVGIDDSDSNSSDDNEGQHLQDTTTTTLKEELEDTASIISPGKILYSTLLDIMHPSEIVRKRAIELYAALHDTFVLQLNVPSLLESHKPSQVYTLAAAAASRHPEMGISVAVGLASLGSNITEAAVRVAAPWIPHIVLRSPRKKRQFREEVIKPLLNATITHPSSIGNALLEYFWPNLQDIPNIASDLLLDAMKASSPQGREAIRQIAANGISLSRPHESQQLAEVMLARLYASLRAPEMLHARKFSDHAEWDDIYNCALLFGSVSVDYRAAEILFADMGFVLFALARAGDFQLRNTMHEMLVNYVSSFLQSPHLSPSQNQRLRNVRTELNSDRCLQIFGIDKYVSRVIPVSVDPQEDDLYGFTVEMSEYFGRLLWETIIGVFGTSLNKYQEARAAVASRIIEFVDILWPPLQRRCILGLIGAVKFYMPEYVVAKLLEILHNILAVEDVNLRDTQVELVNCIMRMFSETIECIPETGKYQMHFFWVAVIALGTSSEPIMRNAVRLLLKSVKIEQLRGAFDDDNIADVFLRARPDWITKIQPHVLLDIPSTSENFHLALVQLLLRPLQIKECEEIAMECCHVLTKACPNCILYTILIYLGGKNEWLIPQIPTGILVDANDTILQWIVTKLKNEDKLAVMSLGYAAYISAYTETPNYTQVCQRTMSLVERVTNRRVVCLISPLLRPALLRLLNLGDPEVEVKLVDWTSKIFSIDLQERKIIEKDAHSLKSILNSFALRPCFDENLKLMPFKSANTFTNDARIALGHSAWLTTLDSQKHDRDELF